MSCGLPTEAMKSITVYHLSKGGGKQTYTEDTSITQGAFLPMTAHAHALLGNAYSDPHELYVPANADLRESDKVVIDSQNYFVKKVFNGWFGGLKHKRATLSTE